MIGANDSDLGFLGVVWGLRLDDFFDSSGEGGTGFFAHGGLSNSSVPNPTVKPELLVPASLWRPCNLRWVRYTSTGTTPFHSARESTLGAGGWHVRDRPANFARRGRSGFNHPVLHISRFVADSLARLAAGRRSQQNSESRSD